MQTVELIFSTLSSWLWGGPLVILLFGTHLYLTIRLGGIQFRKLPKAFKIVFSKSTNEKGDLSHFSSLMTALAATVGIGNIVGVATAITLGGPGAIFWMWLTGLLGMATKYAEALLAVKYRDQGPYGMRGGPMYYLSKGANMPKLAAAFAFFTLIASFGAGNMVQANATAGVFLQVFNIPIEVTGVILAVLTGLVIVGGIHSIGRFTSFFVPLMILLYFGVIVLTLIINHAQVPHAIGLIFSHAFSNHAATGGFVGATLAAAIRFGIARGLFSNEAGQGSAPIVAATAKTKNPVRQALVSMTGTFIDTVVICTLTALAILTTDLWTLGTVSASDLTAQSVHTALGDVGSTLVAICIAFFAFSTLIGWSFYGEKAIEYLFKDKVVKYYRIIFSIVVFFGATASLKLVWDFADLMNGLMAIPNLIGIFMLGKMISSETKRYIDS